MAGQESDLFTITYRSADGSFVGELRPGQAFECIRDGMIINVALTTNA
jgi:hypothetical protein